MLLSTWLELVLATGFALTSPARAGSLSPPNPELRLPASPGHRSRDAACPARCSVSGSAYGNWSVHRSLDQNLLCDQTTYSIFNIYDEIDDPTRPHRIYACSSYGPDWTNLPALHQPLTIVNNTNTTYQVGWWSDGVPQPITVQTLAREMSKYFLNNHAPTNESAVLFVQAAAGAAGIYVGKGLQNEGVVGFALSYLQDNINSLNASSGNVAMQLCGPGSDVDHIFGFIAAGNGTFSQIQNAIQTWNNGSCLSFDTSQNITGPSYFTTPSLGASNSTVKASNATSSNILSRSRHLAARGDCTTVQVASGDSCASLATKCGISGADFTNYNPGSDFCSSLQPGQHVCCSSGTLPDFSPKPNADGSCHSYQVSAGDSCSGIAAANSLTTDQLNNYNSDTWGWSGCQNLLLGSIICLSSGTPPMPATDPNAVCGPTVVGTTAPTNGTAIADLNPCPLNACCDIWGQCGVTAEFCTATNSSTGAPGTAAPGTNGCISNCGTDIVKGAGPATLRNVAYYEAFNFDRSCLYQDLSQLDSSLTHVHFSFATLAAGNYSVSVGDAMSQYELETFKRLQGPMKILTFGGWAFSTSPDTYTIFREGVTPANRVAMATSIANFIHDNDLDGVDIDWEYPGAPDIPGIPPASKDDGANYLAFLAVLKNLLNGKSLSIAAPASYWYLKGFPIAEMSNIVDYIVFMTYDLHGQWDYNNPHSQDGCPTGNCLRSHVNLTETNTALAMITKAGVPSNKVVVGVSSYGRSFGMADASCYTPDCFFTGSATVSTAEKGPCTNTGGYISNAEINAILGDPRRSTVTKSYVDEESNSNILIYDDTNWVAYMDDTIKAQRSSYYQSLGMGGSTLWASDLSQYNDPPYPSNSWADFISKASVGSDPYIEGNRTGNWTSLSCTDPGVWNITGLYPWEQWNELDCPNAWADIVNVWLTIDQPTGSVTFSESLSHVINGPPSLNCGTLNDTSNCDQTETCSYFQGQGVGACAFLIYNSLVTVHEMYSTYHSGLETAFSTIVTPSLSSMEDDFAPVKPPESDSWFGIMLTCMDLIGTVAGSAFFNTYLSTLSYFKTNKPAYDNLKDTTKAFVSFGTSLAGDLRTSSGEGTWTAQSQDEFTMYMGQSIYGWMNLTEIALSDLFSGNADYLSTLTNIISEGKLIEGKSDFTVTTDPTTGSVASLTSSIAKSFYAFAIPSLWNVSSTGAFIADSGASCDTSNPLSDYMSSDDQKTAGYCFNNNMYYLVYPHETQKDPNCIPAVGDQSNGQCATYPFAPVPGIGSLDGTYGGVTLADLIEGAVNTYTANGMTNGGSVADPASAGTLDALYNQDITTPGYVNIPVCTPNSAQASISTKQTSALYYPCNQVKTIDDCGDSTFVDQTTDASPSVSDCLRIVTNIQNTLGEWKVENAVEQQHQIVQYGTCKFGVQGTAINGNVQFSVGAQDIVDIIHSSIDQFQWEGKVGAKGSMNCKGNVKQQSVEWGLY